MNKTVKTAALLLAALMLLLSGCRSGTGGTSSLQAPTDSNTSDGYRDYITLLYSSSDSFNPYTVKTDTNRQLCRLLYEPLVKLDNEFNPDYSIAESVTLDGKECTVKLKNVMFSDGSALSSADVVYSFNLAKNSTTEYAYKLYGALSATASGSDTVIIRTEKADPYFVNVLDFPILKKDSDKLTDSDSVELPPIGSGRYKLNDDRTGLEVNDKFSGSQNFSIREIKLINAPDAESLSHYVEVGAADIYYSDISDGNILRMSGKKVDINLNNIIYIGVNQSYGDLKLPELRQAISSGIDRSAVCRDSYYNNAIAATGFYNPVWEPVKSLQNIETVSNKEITIENLEKIGYNSLDSNGVRKNAAGQKLSFQLLVNSANRLRAAAAQLIAKQLSEYGFKITVVEKSYNDYIKALEEGDFQLYLAEVNITPNMDLSELVLEGGSAAFGVVKPEENGEDKNDESSSDADTEDKSDKDSEKEASSDSDPNSSGDSDGEDKQTTSEILINGFYEGKNTVADIAVALQNEMPFVPVCYRTGVLFYNDKIENVKDSSVSDIYFSIASYKFNDK